MLGKGLLSRLAIIMAALVLAAPLSACGGGSETPSISSTVLSSPTGEVMVLQEGSTGWTEASAGMDIEMGDCVKTGPDGYVLILFFEGSVMEVEEDTEVCVEELITAEDTGPTFIKVWQQIGRTINRVEQLIDPASRYEVKTPAVSSVVRDTEFEVEVEEDGTTTLKTLSGEVLVCAQEVCVEVSAGKQSTTEPGSPPEEPIPSELGPATYHVSTAGDDVTGDGTEGNPWATINHAISQAVSGDTITVHDGTYVENVDVSKSLTIQSMNGAAVTIAEAANPDDHVFEVMTNGVKITGFTVRNASNADGIHLYDSSDDTIESNVCSNNGAGIRLSNDSNRNVIQDNTCSDNDHGGISLYDSGNNTIESNTCSNNGSGITLNGCNSTTIEGNTCSDNDYNGMHVHSSSDNTIKSNTFSGSGSGICLAEHSDNNIIEANTCSNNRDNAIYVYDSSNNTIKTNTCSGPGTNICLLGTSSGNIIESNAGCHIYP